MPVRRFNYTERKRIKHADTDLSISQYEMGTSTFDAHLDLEAYELPEDARVYVEAYRLTAWMRFPYGTVGDLEEPADRLLIEFDNPDTVLFRVRVVDQESGRGLMLAKADGIRPELPDYKQDSRISLLTVEPSDSLRHEIFRLDYAEGRRPVLLVNDKIDDWKSVVRSPAFIAFVLPAVMRQILYRSLVHEQDYSEEDESDWRNRWVRFAESLPGVPEVPDLSDGEISEEWIDSAVEAFCREHQIFKQFRQYCREES